ncbi:O-antigen polymerase [Vibrio splendidus]
MKTILHPIFLYFIGTFIGLSPYFFGSRYFDLYGLFIFDERILAVYVVGFLSFTLGSFFFRIIYTRGDINKVFVMRNFTPFIFVLLIISLVIFLKIISVYGTIPLAAILTGGENINFINEAQKKSGSGIFGLFSLVIFSLVILLPYSIINKGTVYLSNNIFWSHIILLIIYSTYSGKRQMMFILLTYVFTYIYIYYIRVNDFYFLKKIRFSSIVIGGMVVFLFLLIGVIRSNGMDQSVSIFDPIVHYASLPYMNLTEIIRIQESNTHAFSTTSLYETLLSDLPTFIKYSFFGEMHTQRMPFIESTSPSTIYGQLFWSFSYFGVVIFSISIGFISTLFYEKSFYGVNEAFISCYSLTVWPLLSIHTYNHFKNFTFFLIPLLLIIIGRFVYSSLPKNRNYNAT